MNKKIILIAAGLVVLLAAGLALWRRGPKGEVTSLTPSGTAAPGETAVASAVMSPAVQAKASAPIKAVITPAKSQAPVAVPSPSPKKPSILPPDVGVKPSPVPIHKELIPKDIEIVRVYYDRELTGPGSVVEFDINGSGFTREFEKMIKVESGDPQVAVKNLALVTPNQIHGSLVVKTTAKTGAVFPQVLIQEKVVFRAPEPFAVICPAEVLNVMFTEMSENGRSGRFRIFTNLTQSMFEKFSVVPSTPTIEISDVTSQLPFIVDGTLSIGQTLQGSHDLKLTLVGVPIWQRRGLIRIVQPNVGQSGLIHNLRAVDGFHRPGDAMAFVMQGSRFQPGDSDVLTIRVENGPKVKGIFAYKSPGRMELQVALPAEVKEGNYGMSIVQGSTVVFGLEKAFTVVGPNWMRGLKVDPLLKPGEKGSLILSGRDMEPAFINSLKVEVDVEDITLGTFTWISATEASAPIAAGPALLPGDYLLRITANGQTVTPKFGSIIRVQAK